MKAVAVIPARWKSARFPGKPLAQIAGKPLVRHVWEKCMECGIFSEVYVATESRRVADAAQAFGAKTMMTSAACNSGTDRMAEVARRTRGDIYANIQGDGPLVGTREIIECVRAARNAKPHEIITTAAPIRNREQWEDRSVVKVVCDSVLQALYFSRAAIPAVRGGGWPNHCAFAHQSVYVFRRKDLLAYGQLPVSPLEKLERLEMLRALQAGWRIRIVLAPEMVPEVDEPSDVAVVEAAMQKKSRSKM